MSADSWPSWPQSQIDPVTRLRAIAAAIPGATVTEVTIAAPFELVWAVASDLEGELANFIPDVRSVQVRHFEADRSVASIRGRSGLRARFDVVLRPGWCLMQSHFVIGAMAASPSGDHTRLAMLGALRLPGSRMLAPILRPGGILLGARSARRFERRVELRRAATRERSGP